MFNTCIIMYIVPVAECVWVKSGVRSMMEESGEVSVKRDRDLVKH